MAFSKQIVRILTGAAIALAPILMSAQSDIPTGPAVGQKIPAFEAVDQSGHPQTFDTLKGDKGLLLLFFRSADW